jgi:hypothetical protein
MWVNFSGKVGILTDLSPGDIASVMLTDANGMNLLAVTCRASELRQATYEEIPLKRRPDMDMARRLGYAK